MDLMPRIGRTPAVGKLSVAQIAQQSTWTVVPENERITAAMHVIHIVPSNGSTITRVNPVDVGDGCYLDHSNEDTWGQVIPAGRKP